MAKTQAQQAIRDLNQQAARGDMSAADAVARIAAIRNEREVALYRAALEVAARHGGGR